MVRSLRYVSRLNIPFQINQTYLRKTREMRTIRTMTVPKKTVRPDESAAAQSARFIKAAHELGCDESPDAFEAAVKKVARHKSAEDSPPGLPSKSPKGPA